MQKNLKGQIKKFDQKLYDRYDIPARDILKEKLGDKIIDNPDIYAEDMIINDPECKYKFLEIQVCAEWRDKYPHNEPFVYERKGHFNDLTLFILFNREMTEGYFFDKLSLNKEPIRRKKYSRYFIYTVPWTRVCRFITKDLTMDDIYLFQI